MTVSMRAVFEGIGFRADWTRLTDLQPAYIFRSGNLELQALQVTNLYCRPEFFLTGKADERHHQRIQFIELSMPIEVDSFEQGVAWIAYAVNARFVPVKPIPWLEQGRLWRHHLPWERERAARRARPQCVVERDWFRVAAKSLTHMAVGADHMAEAVFTFDGSVLTVRAGGMLLPMPAEGSAWPQDYAVRLADLRLLPKRLMRPRIGVSVWEGKLTLDRLSLELTNVGSSAP